MSMGLYYHKWNPGCQWTEIQNYKTTKTRIINRLIFSINLRALGFTLGLSVNFQRPNIKQSINGTLVFTLSFEFHFEIWLHRFELATREFKVNRTVRMSSEIIINFLTFLNRFNACSLSSLSFIWSKFSDLIGMCYSISRKNTRSWNAQIRKWRNLWYTFQFSFSEDHKIWFEIGSTNYCLEYSFLKIFFVYNGMEFLNYYANDIIRVFFIKKLWKKLTKLRGIPYYTSNELNIEIRSGFPISSNQKIAFLYQDCITCHLVLRSRESTYQKREQ